MTIDKRNLSIKPISVKTELYGGRLRNNHDYEIDDSKFLHPIISCPITKLVASLQKRPKRPVGMRVGLFASATPTTLLRVIQREDYENSKKRLAPLPTAYDKTPTGSYGVSFCSLLQYNLRHRGDFLFSLPFLRNSTPNIGGGHPLGGPKIRV